jgi:rhamnopyranosyl-N-acetylglucosaminyl-diphospho-decaprenol beta-1,3/1,4-galactofuranosyltransferase
MDKVIAVVVTYNRQALLSECINALRSQTRRPDAIFIVNNGSTDNTEQWLQSQDDLFFVTQKNVGSSGGFSTGITWAYKQGYSWIWCMDDDGYPKEDALEKLLENSDDELCLRNCAVIDKADKKTFVWKTQQYKTIDEVNCRVIEGIGHPFNGTMLHRRIVERVGVPKPKLFLWGDETEYYYRIVKQNRIPVCTISDSIHYHPATAFSYKQDWDYQTGWKMYFYIRNRFHIHQAKFSNRVLAFAHYICFLAAFAGIVMVYQKSDKFKKLGFIFWPARDAFSKKFHADPPFILARLKAQSSISAAALFNNYIKNAAANLFAPFAFNRARRSTAGA